MEPQAKIIVNPGSPDEYGEFREDVANFFKVTWPQISQSMIGRVNDSFQVIQKVSSS